MNNRLHFGRGAGGKGTAFGDDNGFEGKVARTERATPCEDVRPSEARFGVGRSDHRELRRKLRLRAAG